MSKNKLILLGASKRYESLLLLNDAGQKLGVHFNIFSVESDSSEIHPIEDLAKIIDGPDFSSPDLLPLIKEIAGEDRTIVIPFMDAASVALSGYPNSDLITMLSSRESEHLTNKRLMKAKAETLGVLTIPNTPQVWPKILKPESGFGSRGHRILNQENDLATILRCQNDLIIEDFLTGSESTVDAYFTKNSKIHSVIARDRLVVEAGEVIKTRTRNPTEFETNVVSAFSSLELVGPVNFQFLTCEGETYLMEINPRFSGGSTASIRAGWDAWSWILVEYLIGQELLAAKFQHLDMIRSRRDHVRIYEA